MGHLGVARTPRTHSTGRLCSPSDRTNGRAPSGRLGTLVTFSDHNRLTVPT